MAGTFKQDFKGPWDVYTQEMHDYCLQDTLASVKVFEFLMREVEQKYNN